MNPNALPPPQAREHPDPHEAQDPIPWPVILFLALLLAFGIVYISLARVDDPGVWGDDRRAAELQGGAGTGAAKADGAALYASLCAACHQASGSGVPGVFPPLAGSEWVQGSDAVLARIVLQGVTGKLTVRGQAFQGAMPSFKGQLSDVQLAVLLSHLRGQWGHSAAPVDARVVAAARQSLEGRAQPFGGEEELRGLAQ